MATASNTTLPHHSPRAAAAAGGSGLAATPAAGSAGQAAAAVSSPKSRRSSTPRGVSSPWTQIVRGGESESPLSSASNTTAASATASVTTASVSPYPPSSSGAVPELVANASSDWSDANNTAVAGVGATLSLVLNEEPVAEAQLDSSENGGGSNAGKKPAWNRPSNGAADVSPVMGAVSWPALSESTKASPKSSSTDSLKNLFEGSASGAQGIGMGSVSSPRQVSSNHANPSSTPNHVAPARQRSMKHRGGGNNSASANGGFLQAPPPQGVGEIAANSSGKSGHSSGESSSRETTHKEGGQRGSFGSQPHIGGEHHQQRNSFRRGNSGPHPRGDGSHHHNYGSRRDHSRGNQDWNSQRNFGSRDAHMQPQRGPSRPFMQGPPHANNPYVPPPPITVRPPPFGTPMVYPEVPSPVFYVPSPHPDFRAVPMVAPMAPVFIPVDPHLPMKIVNQIEYYFSNENLVKDTYLRQNMDEQGWVSIKLIANFKKVLQLTEDIQLILTVLQASNVVEVEGEKVRRRDDWTKWIIPRSVQYSPVSSPQALQRSSSDLLAEHIQGVTLVDKKTRDVHAEEYPSRSSSVEFSSQSHLSGNEMTGIVTTQSGQPTMATGK